MKHIRQFSSFSEASNFLWSIADLLRGEYKQHDFGKVILPFTVLRRLDCVLADTKDKVLARHEKLKGGDLKNLGPVLNRITGTAFHNVSKLDFARLLDDPSHIAKNLTAYIKGFSEEVREIFIERFKIQEQIETLREADLLFLVTKRFTEVDLHPDAMDNHMMGSVFEDLIRRFAEQANETAGEHFTPREVIRLMVNLLFMEDDRALRDKGVVRTLYDPACGTGGMLSVAEDYLRALNPDAHLDVYGQELNDESFAICKADMLLKAENPGNVARGNSFSQDEHTGKKFDYMLSNPPFGVEWKKVEKAIKDEYEEQGMSGRFGAGLPRINDGSFLFLQHMISKMKPPAKAARASPSLIAWICGPAIEREFLLRVFYAMEHYLERFTFGATIRTIGMDDVRTLVTPVPPVAEQRASAEYVKTRVRSIDAATHKVEAQLTAIREYRQALITEAVTGKLDVAQEADRDPGVMVGQALEAAP